MKNEQIWKVGQNVKSSSKKALFQMSTFLKFDFPKGKQLHFSEENYIIYTKKAPLHLTFTFSLKQGKQEKAVDPSGAPKHSF